MKFVILIHSHPQPWAHPTSEHTAEYQALPPATQERAEEIAAAFSCPGDTVELRPVWEG